MSKDSEQLARIKAGLKCSDEEAAEILAYDKAVDHGEQTPHDLTPAQNTVAQSDARTGTRKPTVYKLRQLVYPAIKHKNLIKYISFLSLCHF